MEVAWVELFSTMSSILIIMIEGLLANFKEEIIKEIQTVISQTNAGLKNDVKDFELKV